MDTRQTMLSAFDRLFTKTAGKLQVSYTEEELSQAKEQFAGRMAKVLEVLDDLPFEVVPQDVLEEMEAGIEEVSPTQIVAQLTSIPLMQHTQFLLQRIAHQAAQQRMLESALDNVDTSYGGN